MTGVGEMDRGGGDGQRWGRWTGVGEMRRWAGVGEMDRDGGMDRGGGDGQRWGR